MGCIVMIHGNFFAGCFIMPMTGVFSSMADDETKGGGVTALLIWCAYFLPVGVLAIIHFRMMEKNCLCFCGPFTAHARLTGGLMLRIGIIDQYLDNWHCSYFPQFMREAIARWGFDADVTQAWAEWDRPPAGGVSTEQWCHERNISRAPSPEALIEECDALMVIAADDASYHETLCQKPFRSGKPVFVDKTFAIDAAAGKRMFDLARACGTPVFSSSAQRYCQSVIDWKAAHPERPAFVSTVGPHSIDRYAVHQLEVISALMGTGIKRIKAFSLGSMVTQLILDYGSGRWASFMQTPQPYAEFNFMVSEDGESGARLVSDESSFYHNLMKAMLDFFISGKPPVSEAETIEILRVIDKARIAREQPDTWFTLDA